MRSTQGSISHPIVRFLCVVMESVPKVQPDPRDLRASKEFKALKVNRECVVMTDAVTEGKVVVAIDLPMFMPPNPW